MSGKAKIAIATGDPAGIGPEICLKAALDPAVRAACHPVLVSDPHLLARHAKLCGIKTKLCVIPSMSDAGSRGTSVDVLLCWQPGAEKIALGKTGAAAGRASIAFCRAAIRTALTGEADAVAAAPQNETSIAQARIKFDGHPSFVARETGTREDEVFMMLCFGTMKIAHATLHQSVRQALDAITRDQIARVIRATDNTLRHLGIAAPKICVSGLNPHAGENGLFGREEIEIIKPAVDEAAAQGVAVTGPFGADTMFQRTGIDAFIVMLHDQGHIAAKVLAPNAVVALTIGTPILFASVAHGSAHDIAGKGIADPAAMIEAILRLSKAPRAGTKPVAA